MRYRLKVNGRNVGRCVREHEVKTLGLAVQALARMGWDAEIVEHVPKKRED